MTSGLNDERNKNVPQCTTTTYSVSGNTYPSSPILHLL